MAGRNSQAKSRPTTVEFKLSPKEGTLLQILKYGLVHNTPDFSVPLGRNQCAILFGFWCASQRAADDSTEIPLFQEFICDLLVKRSTGGLDAYNTVVRRVVRRGFSRRLKDKAIIDRIMHDLRPYIRDTPDPTVTSDRDDRPRPSRPELGDITKNELLAETRAIRAKMAAKREEQQD